MIKFNCKYCGQKVSTSDETGGKMATCPKCKMPLNIPINKPDQKYDCEPEIASKAEIHRFKELVPYVSFVSMKLPDHYGPNPSAASRITWVTMVALTNTILGLFAVIALPFFIFIAILNEIIGDKNRR